MYKIMTAVFLGACLTVAVAFLSGYAMARHTTPEPIKQFDRVCKGKWDSSYVIQIDNYVYLTCEL